MTFRICLFGTSHLASLYLAYQAAPDNWAQLDMKFIQGSGSTLLDHRIEEARMYATTGTMRHTFQRAVSADHLNLEAFDAFVLIGCHVGPNILGHLYNRARWCSLPSMSGMGIDDASGWTLISEPLLDAFLRSRNSAVLGGQLAHRLRDVSTKPILLASVPRPGARLMTLRQHKAISHKRAIRNGDAQTLSDRYEKLTYEQYAKAGVRYLAQPQNSIEDHLLTKSEYVANSAKLTSEGAALHADDDLMHGNLLYGALVLDQILAHMEE